MSAEEQIRALPKLEQHIHIVGSTRPETLLWLVEQSGIDFPCRSLEDVQRYFQYSDFDHFISVYSTINDCIKEERQLERIAFEMLETEANCNVKHVEAIFSTFDHVRRGLDHCMMVDALNRGIGRAHEKYGIGCSIRVDLVRNYGPEIGMKVLDMIEENGDNIIAVDLGGSERGFPPRPYEQVFSRAKEMGLHLVAHAGEASGPESIWDATRYLKVERIGHGVAAIKDRDLPNHLRRNAITVETCPVSNERTNVVPSIKEHPIRSFFDGGMSVTVNSDDPSMFGTDMNYEYLQLHRELGFTVPELFKLSLNAVDSSFMSEEEKVRMHADFEKEYLRIT